MRCTVTGFVATGVATNLDPGLDHAVDWTGLKTFGNGEFCGLLNSLQVAQERKSLGPAVENST